MNMPRSAAVRVLTQNGPLTLTGGRVFLLVIGFGEMKNTRHLFQVLTWAGIAALSVLSWTPGDYMIRTGADGHLEHVAAYVLASAAAALGYGPRRGYAQIGAAYCVYAGLLELGQIVVPGRHAGIDDFAASSIGSLLGVSLIWLWAKYRPLR